MEAYPYIDTSLLDLVFENRNKAYGAYQLRQLYASHLMRASFIAISTIGLFWGLCFYLQHFNTALAHKVPPALKDNPIIQLSDQDIILEKITLPPAAPHPPVSVQTPASSQLREMRIVTDQTPVISVIPDQQQFAAINTGLMNQPGDQALVTGEELTEGAGVDAPVIPIGNEPFSYVETMPEYAQGGQVGMYKFINQHLRYPRLAQEQGLEGMVVVSFIISPTGEVTGLQILKDIGSGTGEEASRVMALMPKWKPGFQNQQAVPVRMTLPIRFKLH